MRPDFFPSCLIAANFPDPVSHILAPGGHPGFSRQGMIKAEGVAGGDRVPPASLDWYFSCLVCICLKILCWAVWFCGSQVSTESYLNSSCIELELELVML